MVETNEDSVACPLCTSMHYGIFQSDIRDHEYETPGNYSWLECQDCGLVRLDPLPSPKVLDLAYPPHYHAFAAPNSRLTKYLVAASRKGLAKRLVKMTDRRGSVLDLGCSTGDLLVDVGKLGKYKLFGVEYKKEAALTAKERGIRVWHGTLEESDIDQNSMDLIIMQHILEHVWEPVQTLQQCYSILKTGGSITGELPNINSWDASIFGPYWGGGHAPRHIWHFNPTALRRALIKCGFESISIRPALHTGHWALSFQNFFRRKKTNTKDLVSGRAWYYPFFLLVTIPINILQMALGRTGIMTFTAKKS